MIADLDKQRSLSEWWSRRPDQLVPISCLAADITDAESVIDAADGHDILIIDTPTAVEEHPSAVKILLLAADFVLDDSHGRKFGTTQTRCLVGWNL